MLLGNKFVGGGVIKLFLIYYLDEKYVNNKISHTTLIELCISSQKAQFILITLLTHSINKEFTNICYN